MKKKGFTLIEIIVCIAVIAVIGTASFFGIRLINKNIKASKLEQISDKIMQAVGVYVENNEEARNQLYNNKNGVLVPLAVLEQQGLIDFQDIDIDEKKDYVLTLLGSGGAEGACIDTTTIGSWEDGNKTIYLCTDKDGNGNLTSIGFAGNNLSLTSKSRVWFYTNYLGENYGVEAINEAKANNYITYDGRTFKIYYIDRDDSLVLLSYDSFGTLFNNKTQNVDYYERETVCNESTPVAGARDIHPSYFANYDSNHYFVSDKSFKTKNGEVPIGFAELWDSGILWDKFVMGGKTISIPANIDEVSIKFSGPMNDIITQTRVSRASNRVASHIKDFLYCFKDNNQIFKIHLKPCMKISGGSGDTTNPYILSNYC